MDYTKDLAQTQWQQLSMKIPPTHIRLETLEGGKFRLTYFDKLARWEESENIDSKVATIMKERGTQRVAMDGLRGHHNTEGGKSDNRGGGPSNNVLGHGDNNRPIQHQNIQNNNTLAALEPKYPTINSPQTRIEGRLDLNKDNMIQTRTVSDRDNNIQPKMDFQG